MKTNVTLVVVFGAALLSAWPVYSRIRQSRRDVIYRTAIAPFQRDLHVGMARIEVEKYLASRHVEYHPVRFGGGEGVTYEIDIGEEDSLTCDWSVYVALEFGPSDALREVHIRKVGDCM